MRTTHQLPSWLGGHEVELLHLDPHNAHNYVVQTVGGDNPHEILSVRKTALVEVKPPSIDDPVELPLTVSDEYGDGIRVFEAMTSYHGVAAQLVKTGADGELEFGASVHLAPEQCRDLARALWLLGNGGAA